MFFLVVESRHVFEVLKFFLLDFDLSVRNFFRSFELFPQIKRFQFGYSKIHFYILHTQN